MSMDWTGIKAITTTVFAQLTGLSEAQVRWADDSEGSVWTDDPHLEITMLGPRQIGQDEERRDDSADGQPSDPTTNDGVVTVCGPREFTLTVACESQVQTLDDSRNAAAILSNLLTRFGRTSTVEALDPYYAISDWTDIKRVPYRDAEGRLINRYVIDLLCLAADNDVDDTLGAGGWIGEVIGTGTVTDGGVNTQTVNFDVKES
jgi:hypothetical protein